MSFMHVVDTEGERTGHAVNHLLLFPVHSHTRQLLSWEEGKKKEPRALDVLVIEFHSFPGSDYAYERLRGPMEVEP